MTAPDEVSAAAAKLLDHAKRYHEFQEDPAKFLAELHRLREADLRDYMDWSERMVMRTVKGVKQISPVVFLRRVIVTRILAGDEVILNDLDEYRRRIESRDTESFSDFPKYLDAIAAQRETPRSPFANWTPFRILFYVHYFFIKDEVQTLLKRIAKFLQESLELEDCDYHIAGFDYNNNFGTDRCWLALYPAWAEDHKNAYQLIFAVHPDGYRFGLDFGRKIRDPKQVAPQSLEGPLEPEELADRYRGLLPRFRELNQELLDRPGTGTDPIERRFPMNMILYGPPGTGKTYSVQRRALEIIDGPKVERSQEEIASRFREQLAGGRIEFVTFHPSYSYEEFVEGFRYHPELKVPVLQDGAFKRLVRRAADPFQRRSSADGAQIWKVSLGRSTDSDVFERCMQRGEIAVGDHPDQDMAGQDEEEIHAVFEEVGRGRETNNTRTLHYLINEMQEGDYVAILKDQKTIRAIGVVAGPYAYKREYSKYPHTRPVEWVDRRDHEIYEMNGSRYIGMPTIYRLNHISIQDFVELLPQRHNGERPFVLIIDEINRGNLPRIFGELITLLEPDKRRGRPNELRARLPYSQESFTVPANVYVIGTMNTADRSIALLDVALRRRFEFEEMMPRVDVVRDVLSEAIGAEEDEDVELTADQVELTCNVLAALNRRITVLLDRDHQIGHSYFLGVRSMADLHRVLYQKVFPLLQEYFYNDRERLERMLGVYDSGARRGFVTVLKNEYQKAFGDGSSIDAEMPWEIHRYRVGDLEDALRNTFGPG